MLTTAANPGLAAAQANAPVTVIANPARCSFQFDPIGKNKFDRTACYVAKSHLGKAGVPYASQDAGADWATVTVGQKAITIANPPGGLGASMTAAGIPYKLTAIAEALPASGYPATPAPPSINTTPPVST